MTDNRMALERATWRASTRGVAGSARCVQVATTSVAHVAIRDSKLAGLDCPVLTLDRGNWSAFLADIATGEFDEA
ncbi:DUF397 domain-containing protein [Phytomonospora sp. NPDC050363]|uniref:DUF397 domain-containing protein n=1 Tax=Phytomonospora sp. NPDC050363 TaxID=3155642 RepID=UPI0033C51BFF